MLLLHYGLLRGACHRARIRATRWLAMTAGADVYRSRGSSASRRPSPTRLNDSTTRKIASPGHSAIHGALVRKRGAALSMLPQDGEGGCCPKPKNDSAASAMIAAAIESVACTNSAGMMFGRM